MSDFVKMLLLMTVASVGLCGLAAALFFLIYPRELALASTIGVFVGCMICTWVLEPIINRWR